MRRHWLGLLVVTAVLLGAAFYVWPRYLRFQRMRQGEAHAVGFTRESLRTVALGILTLCEADRMRLVDISEGEQLMAGAEIYSRLSQSADAIEVARPSEIESSRHAFCDRWGNEIHARIRVMGRNMHVILWSEGLNKVNEDAKGDDIVEEVDIVLNDSPKSTNA